MLRSFTHTFHRHSKKRRTNSDLMAKELRSAIERAQWGELNSKTERSEENMEQIIAASERRSSCHSDLHQTDLDSDTDDEDCILPRVELEEATPSTCELEERLPMARTSSDVSDQYITDENGVLFVQFVLHFLTHLHYEVNIAPSQSTSITGGSDELKSTLPSKLESYLEAFGEKSAGQKKRASILTHFFLTHKAPGPGTIKSTRRVLIVEPKEGPLQMGGADEKIDGDFEDIDHINGDTAAQAAQDSCSHNYDDLSEVASKGHSPQTTMSDGIMSNQELAMVHHENTIQQHIVEKCNVWIDDDDESFTALSRSVQAADGEPVFATSDGEPASTASTSHPVQRRESASFFISHENEQIEDVQGSMFTYHRPRRSVSDVIPPRAFHNMPMEQEMRNAILEKDYGTSSSSAAENFI
uniref:R3H domain-containing protein n=1 Tax=Parascaris equorum TaxID=6256 RepID=A0A914RMM1_PAREQ